MRFEREWCGKQEDKVSIADARKVRWILIYGVLQMLVSATRAPKEVRDTESPAYPLCCLVAGNPPWKAGFKPRLPSADSFSNLSQHASTPMLATTSVSSSLHKSSPAASPMSIHPDCETDDYFKLSHGNNTTPQRQLSIKMPAPLRPAGKEGGPAALLRNASTRSKRLSFSPFSSRRNSIVVKPLTPAFCEILVHGYGNGLNETVVDSSSSIPVINEQPRSEYGDQPQELQESVAEAPSAYAPEELAKRRKRPGKLTVQFAPIPQPDRTPILESFQIDDIHASFPDIEAMSLDSAEDSDAAALSPVWSSGASASSSDNVSDLLGMDHMSVRSSRSSSVRRSENNTPLSSIEGESRGSTIWIVDSSERDHEEPMLVASSNLERQSGEFAVGVGIRNGQIDFYSALEMLPGKTTDLLEADVPQLMSKPRIEKVAAELQKSKAEEGKRDRGKNRKSVRAKRDMDMDIFAALGMGPVKA